MRHRIWLPLALWLMLLMDVAVYAGIEYSMDDSPSFRKTITWSSSDGDAEYRYLSAESTADDFESAAPVGQGGHASITVDSNGIYSLFAKSGDVIQVVTVPVATIDQTPPVIVLDGVSQNADGSVDASYHINDYFGVADTRIAPGTQPESAFGQAAPISGGVAFGLSPGRYTIFAKDLAGNVSIYPLTVGMDGGACSTESSERTEWSMEWREEWGDNWLRYDKPDIQGTETLGPSGFQESGAGIQEPPASPAPMERLPQTGGCMEARSLQVIGSMMLVLSGASMVGYLRRRGKR